MTQSKTRAYSHQWHQSKPVDNIYLESGSADSFERAIQYDSQALRQAADITKKLLNGRRHIQILDIGVGPGGFTLPLIEGLESRPDIKCELHCFDNAETMLNKLEHNLRNHYALRCKPEIRKRDAKHGLFSRRVIDQEQSLTLAKVASAPRQQENSYNRECYDLVIVTFVLHYLDSKQGSKILRESYDALRDTGLLLQAEIIGDLRYMDGQFDVSNLSTFERFWRHYFKLRAQFDVWDPSRMVAVSNLSGPLQYCQEKIKGGKGFWRCHQQDFTWKRLATWNNVCEWIESGPVSSLASGLKPEQKIRLAAHMRQWLKDEKILLTEAVELNWGFRLNWLRKLPQEAKQMTELWQRFNTFSQRSVPTHEYKRQLPLIPGGAIVKGTQLQEYIMRLIKDVLHPTIGRECLFLDVCLWDPFRAESEENWALSGSGINQIDGQLVAYLQAINDAEINLFYLLYRKLKKQTLKITVTPEGKVSPVPPLETFHAPDEITQQQLEKVIDFHVNFRHSYDDIHIYYLPTIFHPHQGTGVGGVIFISPVNFTPPALAQVSAMLEATLSKIGVNYLFYNFYSQSVRSAVAAIMGRNMSHNMGSHVLARLSTEQEAKNALFDPALPRQAAKLVAELNEFLRTRMDFVADISTANLPPSPTVLSFWSELLQPVIKQRLLWDKLCASHSLHRSNIHFLVCIADGRSTSVCKKLKAGSQDSNTSEELPAQMVTANIGIPNGSVGCQAFYCILENFVRNAAKHGVRPERQPLTVSVCLYTEGDWNANDDLFKVIVQYDWQSCKGDPELVGSINTSLNHPLIREDGSLAATDRGLKEMKAAASYLRRLAPESIDSPEVDPPLLRAVDVDGNLGYEFYLLRPKDLLIVDPSLRLTEKQHSILRRQGIDVVCDVETARTVGPDYAMLFIRQAAMSLLEDFSDCALDLPLRVIVEKETEIEGRLGIYASSRTKTDMVHILAQLRVALEQLDGQTTLAHAWKLWTKIVFGKDRTQVWVYEDAKHHWGSDISHSVSREDRPEDNHAVVLYARHGHPHRQAATFYEPYGKGDAISFVLEHPPSWENTRSLIAHQLLEAGLLQIIILDERIQEGSAMPGGTFSEDPAPQQSLAAWLRCMRIYIPSKTKIDLASEQLKREQFEPDNPVNIQLHREIQAIYQGGLPPVLVVHQGILDAIGLKERKKAEVWIEGLKKQGLVSEVVITSGRGNPDNIASNARFLPLSTVMLYTTERKSKLHLVQALFAARRAKK